MWQKSGKNGKRTGGLEHDVERVAVVLRRERQGVVVARALEDLGQRRRLHAQRDVAVAAVVLEALGAQQQRHERHVRAVHGLQRQARLGAVDVALGDEVLHGLHDELHDAALGESGLEHGG
ncbi:hypothetical protein ON010_g12008 [Phytophthora cinnamomi]|nr:hypothetical protein ON010_g12008 [Phytophthora cinnamomi]